MGYASLSQMATLLCLTFKYRVTHQVSGCILWELPHVVCAASSLPDLHFREALELRNQSKEKVVAYLLGHPVLIYTVSDRTKPITDMKIKVFTV